MVAPEFFPEDLIVCFDFSFYPCDCESFSGRMAIPKESAVVGYNHHRVSSSSSIVVIIIININRHHKSIIVNQLSEIIIKPSQHEKIRYIFWCFHVFPKASYNEIMFE